MGGLALSGRQLRWFAAAKAAAQCSDYARARVGAVVVLGKTLLGVGCSSHKTHPVQDYWNRLWEFRDATHSPATLHAECAALAPLLYRSNDIDWSRVELYVCRLRGDQPFGMARPCKACMGLIRELGIRDVYYTTDDGFAHERIV